MIPALREYRWRLAAAWFSLAARRGLIFPAAAARPAPERCEEPRAAAPLSAEERMPEGSLEAPGP